jgi:ankyrin repeat protein
MRLEKETSVKSLIKSGCDVNIQNGDGMTLLILASSLENPKIIKFLIDSGTDVNQINKNAQTLDEHDRRSYR